MAKKWMAGCETLEEVLGKLVVEQLLDTMGSELRIWVSEKKHKSGSETGGSGTQVRRQAFEEQPRSVPIQTWVSCLSPLCKEKQVVSRVAYR